MKKFFRVSLLGIILFNFHYQLCNENQSEFVISREKTKKNLQSSSKLRESIVKNYGDILNLDLNLNKFSIDLREFALKEIEEYLVLEGGFLTVANKNQLQESLDELIVFKKNLENSLNDLKKKLVKVKSKFIFNQKNHKDANG